MPEVPDTSHLHTCPHATLHQQSVTSVAALIQYCARATSYYSGRVSDSYKQSNIYAQDVTGSGSARHAQQHSIIGNLVYL